MAAVGREQSIADDGYRPKAAGGSSQERPFKVAVQPRPLRSEHNEASLDHLAGALQL
jgi:hypothetical protein